MFHSAMRGLARGMVLTGAVALAGGLMSSAAFAQWAPTKTVEFIVPAGSGGGVISR